ncbi:hypothetical protein CPC16_011060 [Podila verticillata]|nr:hypothetical protein CPC16_011060 [Podila verticillata]
MGLLRQGSSLLSKAILTTLEWLTLFSAFSGIVDLCTTHSLDLWRFNVPVPKMLKVDPELAKILDEICGLLPHRGLPRKLNQGRHVLDLAQCMLQEASGDVLMEDKKVQEESLVAKDMVADTRGRGAGKYRPMIKLVQYLKKGSAALNASLERLHKPFIESEFKLMQADDLVMLVGGFEALVFTVHETEDALARETLYSENLRLKKIVEVAARAKVCNCEMFSLNIGGNKMAPLHVDA